MATLQEWGEFLEKMEWEGGIEGMLTYGGPEAFPAELRKDATSIWEAMQRMHDVIEFKHSEIWVNEQD